MSPTPPPEPAQTPPSGSPPAPGAAGRLSEGDLDALARLCRLRVEPDERAEVLSRLAAILDHARALESLDLDGVSPMLHPHEEPARLDHDTPREPLPREALEGMAPAWDGRFIKVPKVLGE